MTRIAIFVLAALATITVGPMVSAQEHIEYPWCANYGNGFGGSNCGFSTIEQCRATISGMGGFCDPNPFYRPSSRNPARHSRHSG